MRIVSIVALISFLFCVHVNGQGVLEPVTWDWKVEKANEKDHYFLIFEATIDAGWKIYSQYLESDDGPVRTSFFYDTKDGFALIGKNEESGKIKSGYDAMFDMDLITLKAPKASFKQEIKVSQFPLNIAGYLEFMTCDDKQCLPPTGIDFEFNIAAPQDQTDKKKTVKPDESRTDLDDSSNSTVNPEAPSDNQQVNTTNHGQKVIYKSNTPVSWSIQANKISNDEIALVFIAEMKDGWSIYSQFTSDDGPVPTSFELENCPHEFPEKAEEQGKMKEGLDPMFDVVVKKYPTSPVTFTQKVSLNGAEPITGFLNYMTCDDKQCLPPTPVDFWVDPISLETFLGDDATSRTTDAQNMSTGNFTVNLGSNADAKEGQLLQGNILDQKIGAVYESQQEPLSSCGINETTKNRNLLWTFIFGFLGGLLALLTPCVFPMIPLTVSYFTKGSKDRKSGMRNGLIYGLSIIVIYVSIGLIITWVFGATALNALSTNWIANTLFFAIFVVFAFSFFGFFEITLPSSWANASDRMADSGGLIGTFFMAFTLAIVSFSCTGPIIGSALVQSATEALGPFTVMLGFSMALALPFGLFAAFPAWLNSLPQSGGWMNSVKVVLGFLELALALKFLSVADMTMHWGILKYELFMGLWVIIFALLTLYLFGLIKFPHDSPIKKLSTGRWVFGLLFGALTVYLFTGFFMNPKTKVYNSLALMSGLAPPATYNYLLEPPQPNLSIKEKYPSFTKCANNIDCFKDYFEGMEYAKENNKPVLLDFTGYGCVNCRKTEEHIWVKDRVRKKLNEDFVLVSLYVDDRKKLKETLISKHTEKKIRSIGNKWADFQIVNFEQNSQPLYVMMTPEQEVIADPRGYKEGVSDYLEFLNCGLNFFKEKG